MKGNTMTTNQNCFVRPKQAWQMLAIGRSTFYRYVKEKKNEGFPQIHKMCGMSVIRIEDILAYQAKICGDLSNE